MSASSTSGSNSVGVAPLASVHATFWLVVANGVGLWMATILVFPGLGRLLGPWTYGRWAMLHLDLQLYGWCALPMVALLLHFYRVREAGVRLALAVWSGALATGAISWLAGQSAGKLFLDWTGGARLVFLLALFLLAAILAHGWWTERARLPVGALWGGGLLLPILLAVPVALASATGDGYPAVNPESGGPTGTSLLASTLGMIPILVAVPRILGLERRRGPLPALPDRWLARLGLALLGFQLSFVALAGFGNHSHHDPAQQVGLATTLLWWLILGLDLARFDWPAGLRRWVRAGLIWGLALGSSGVVTFLPGVLERWKFTQVLVAHAHVAMAGMLTCLGALVLGCLEDRGVFDSRSSFWAWNGGLVVLVFALTVLGMLEAHDPLLVPRGGAIVDALYLLRWSGGVAMLGASIAWLSRAVGERPHRSERGREHQHRAFRVPIFRTLSTARRQQERTT